MTRRDRLGHYPLAPDAEGVRTLLLAANTESLTLHLPGRDGLCPICRERLCAVRLGAVRALRSGEVRAPDLPPHPPRRPQWECELCDCPWPCSQARVMFGDQFEEDRNGLAEQIGRLTVAAAR